MENTSESKRLDFLMETQETEGLEKEYLSAQTENGETGKDIDVHARNGKGRTPLMEAAARDDSEAIKYLLALGSDVNAQDDFGWTALLIAAHKTKNPDVAGLLLQAGADVTLRNDAGKNVFFYTKMNGYLKGSGFYKRLTISSESAKKEPQKKFSDVLSEPAVAEMNDNHGLKGTIAELTSESTFVSEKAES